MSIGNRTAGKRACVSELADARALPRAKGATGVQCEGRYRLKARRALQAHRAKAVTGSQCDGSYRFNAQRALQAQSAKGAHYGTSRESIGNH